MSDLLIFAGVVALVIVIGMLVGIIVAGRIDRILAPGPAHPGDGDEAAPGREPAADGKDRAAAQEDQP